MSNIDASDRPVTEGRRYGRYARVLSRVSPAHSHLTRGHGVNVPPVATGL
jgi:hypothetical protein